MEKIRYKMTADDFYRGTKFKMRKTSIKSRSGWYTLVLAILFSVASVMYKLGLLCYIMSIVTFVMSIYSILSPTKKIATKEYNDTRYHIGEKTITFDDERIKFVSNLEEIDMPLKDVSAYKMTRNYLYVLPVKGGEIFVINRHECEKAPVDKLYETLCKTCKKTNLLKKVPSSEKEEVPLVRTDFSMESKDFFDFDIAIDFYDMVQYQKMFLKNIRYTATCFGMAGVYVILVLIDFLITRNTMNFIFIGVALLITVFSIAYSYFANTIRKAQKIACSDKFCQRKTNIIVEEFYVEVIIKSEDDGLFFSRVFPYPLISTVLENDRYIAFSAAVDKQIIIPKRYMEPYQKTKLINLLKENNKLYARVKD